MTRRVASVETALAVAGSLALGLCFIGPFLVSGGLPAYRDLLLTYLPLRVFWAEGLAHGELNEWFRFEGLGEPLVGQGVSSPFHPVGLLYLLFPPALAMRLEIASAVLTALLAQTVLARRLGLRAWAAVTCGVAFAMSGYALSMTSNVPYLRGLGLLPAVALGALEVSRGRSPALWAAVLALAWGLIPLGGDAAATLLAGVVVLAVWLVRPRLRRLAWLGLAGALALALAAAELVPAALNRPDSIVASFNNAEFLSSFWAFHPERWVELLVPRPRTVERLWTTGAYAEPGLWAESVLLGPAVIGLVLVLPWRRWALSFAALGVLGLWLASGAHGGLDTALRGLMPMLNTVRYPEKHLALAVFALTLTAGFGAQRLLRKPRKAGVLAQVLAATGVVGWRAGSPPVQQVLGAGLVLLAALAAGRVRWARWLVPLGVLLSLWSQPLGLLTVSPSLVEQRPPDPGPDAERWWLERGPSALPVDERTLQQWAEEAVAMSAGDLGALTGHPSFGLTANLPLAPRRERTVLGWALTDARERGAVFGYSRIVPAQGEPLLQPAAPRATFVQPRGVESLSAMRAALNTQPLTALEHPMVIGRLPEPRAGTVGSVRWIVDRPDALELDVEAEAVGVLVLNQLLAPGWSATRDGVEVPVVLVNALVMGVEVPRGTHRVRFAYQAPGLRLGLAVSGVALLLLTVLMAGSFVARRRARS